MSAVNTESIPPSHTNGVIEDGYDEDEKSKIRPADIDADMREMERRKRVELIMNSRLFREELERIIESQIKAGNSSAGLLQQISDMVGSKYSGVNNHLFRSASCAVPINDIRGVEAMGYAKGEKILRCKLAALFRLIDLYGWTQGIYNHVTARLSQQEEHFLVNPYGLLYSEVTASSLVKVDMQGNVIESGTTNFSVNVTGFQLHAAIYAARPDLKCIVHLHTPSVIAVSSFKDGLLPICQEAAVIGDISHHSYIGIPNEPEERDKIVRNLGPNNKVIFLTNHGALCCGETIEETFFYAYNTVNACETQLKVLPLGKDNVVLLSDETRKSMYDSARKIPEYISPPVSNVPSAAAATEKRWRIGGLEFEALMRMLDNAGFRTGYVYRQPLIKGELPRPRNDVEVPPAVSSLGYLFEEEELYKGQWKKAFGGKGNDRIRWLNSPNVYQKVEILETGTSDPKKITKWVDANNEEWVADGSPSHTSTPVKIENALQFVPKNTNPKEFKKLQQQIKENRRADKITSGPQSHILEGVSWEEAKKLQDANMSGTNDQVILVGAASKGIIQREYQHNATVYKTPYAKNPFDAITDEEIENYKKDITRKQRGDSYYDEDESDALSSSLPPSGKRQNTGITSETEDESLTHEMRVIQIETTTVPKASQAEVVLSDDKANRKLSKSQIQAATKAFIKENYDNYTEELKKFYSEELRKFVVRIWEVKKSRPTFKIITMGEPTTQPDLYPTLSCNPEDSSIPKKPKINELFKQIAHELITRFKQGLALKKRSDRPAFLPGAAAPEFHDVSFHSASFDCSDTEITTLIELSKHSRRYSRESLESVHDFSSDPTTEDEEDPMSPEYDANRSSLLSLSSYIGHEYENPEESNEMTPNTSKITVSDTSLDDLTVICKHPADEFELDVDEKDDFSDTSLSSALQGEDDEDEYADIQNTYESLNDVDEDYFAHATGAASKPDDESVTSFVEKASGAKFRPELAVIYEESNASDSKCSLRSILEDNAVFAQPQCERSDTPDTYVIEDEPRPDQDVWVSIKNCISSANALLEHLENRNDSVTVPSVMANCCQMSINTTGGDSDARTISDASLSCLADSAESLEPLKDDSCFDASDGSEKALDSGILMEDVVTWSSEEDCSDMKLCSEIVSAEIAEGRVSSGSDEVEDAVWVTQIEKVFDFDADDFGLDGFFNIDAAERDTGQFDGPKVEEFNDLGVVIDTVPDGRERDDYVDPVVQNENQDVEIDDQVQNHLQIDDQPFPEPCTFRNDNENISADVRDMDNERLTESASSIDSVRTSIFVNEPESDPETPRENYINAGVTLQVPETNSVTITETVPDSVPIEPETTAQSDPEQNIEIPSVEEFDPNFDWDNADSSCSIQSEEETTTSCPIDRIAPDFDSLLNSNGDSVIEGTSQKIEELTEYGQVEVDYESRIVAGEKNITDVSIDDFNLLSNRDIAEEDENAQTNVAESFPLIDNDAICEPDLTLESSETNEDVTVVEIDVPESTENPDYIGTVENDAIQKPSSTVESDYSALEPKKSNESAENTNGVAVIENSPNYESSAPAESIENADYAEPSETDLIHEPSNDIESLENDENADSVENNCSPESFETIDSTGDSDDDISIEDDVIRELPESTEFTENVDHAEPSDKEIDVPSNCVESLENVENTILGENSSTPESFETVDSTGDSDDDISTEDDVINELPESTEFTENTDFVEPSEKEIDVPSNCVESLENVGNTVLGENSSTPESFETVDSIGDSDDDVSIEDDVINELPESTEFAKNADHVEPSGKEIDMPANCTESLENVENTVSAESLESRNANDDVSIENDVIDEPAESSESHEISGEDADSIEKNDRIVSNENDVISISSESTELSENAEENDTLNEPEEDVKSVGNIDDIESVESSENSDDVASVVDDVLETVESDENSDDISDENDVISISSESIESNKNNDLGAENSFFDQPEDNVELFENIAEAAVLEPIDSIESTENRENIATAETEIGSESAESDELERNLESTENINEAVHEPTDSAELSKNSDGIASAEEGVVLESSESMESNRNSDDAAANENEIIPISSESIEVNENGDSGIAENDLFYEPDENIESTKNIVEWAEFSDDAASVEEYANSEPPESTENIDENVVIELAESFKNSDDDASMEEDNSESSESNKNSENEASVEDCNFESSKFVVAAADDVITIPIESNKNIDELEENVELAANIDEAVTDEPTKCAESLEKCDDAVTENDISISESIELDENINNVTAEIDVFDEFALAENMDGAANNEPTQKVESIESNENVDAQNEIFDQPEENTESAKNEGETVTHEPAESIEWPRNDCDIVPIEEDVISISSGSVELDENVTNVTAEIDIFDEFDSIENIEQAVNNEPVERVESDENVDVAIGDDVFIEPEQIIDSTKNIEPTERIESGGSDCEIIPAEEDVVSISSESISSNEEVDTVAAENIVDESNENVELAEDSHLFFSAADVVAGESTDVQKIPKLIEFPENNAEIIDNHSEPIENIDNVPVLQTDPTLEHPEPVESIEKIEIVESNVIDEPSKFAETSDQSSVPPNCLVPAYPIEPKSIDGASIDENHLKIDPAVVRNEDLVALTSYLTTTSVGTETNAIGSIFGYLSSTDYFVESITNEEAAATDVSNEMNDNYVTISDADSSNQINHSYLTISDASMEKSSSPVGDDESSHPKGDSSLDRRTPRSKHPDQRKSARQNVRTSVRLTNRRSIKRTSPLKKESSTDDEIRPGAAGGCDEKKPKLEHSVTNYSVKLKLHIEWDNNRSSSDSVSTKSSFEDSLNCSESTSEGKRDRQRHGYERVRLLTDFKNDYPKFISYQYFSPKVKLRTSRKSPRTKTQRKSVSLESSPTGRYHRFCHISRDFNVQSKSANVTPKRPSPSIVKNLLSQRTVRKPFKCRNTTETDSLKTSTPVLLETEVLTKESIIECLTSNTLSPITNSLEEFELIESLLTSCEK